MARIATARQSLPPGGGPYRLDRLTLGVFLTDQPTHRLSIGGDKRTDKPLAAQDGWILPAGAEGVCEFDAPLDLVTVSLDAETLRAAGLDAPDAIRPLVGAVDPLLLQMAIAADRFDAGGPLYAQTMQVALAAQIARQVQPVPAPAARIEDTRLARVVARIHDDPAADLALADLADLAAMSPFHFSRAFKAATGRAPLQYVLDTRIDAAKALLKSTKLPVAEVAWRVGFQDTSRFGKQFKARTGTTPAAFRAG